MNNFIKVLIIIAMLVVVWFTVRFIIRDESQYIIQNFMDCIQAGYPAMESYPRRCQDDKGNVFTEDIGNELEKIDLIRIDNPRPNQAITSPLIIEGQARGFWFFEADFPIKLLDENNQEITIGHATAQDEWMTEDFVQFKAELNFTSPGTGQQGTLILEKDNPSDLPENDDQLRVPVLF